VGDIGPQVATITIMIIVMYAHRSSAWAPSLQTRQMGSHIRGVEQHIAHEYVRGVGPG